VHGGFIFLALQAGHNANFYNCRNVCAIARMRGELFAACCPGNCNYVRKRIAMEK
jgi:hypothetical protein